jgi:hypothetical protein
MLQKIGGAEDASKMQSKIGETKDASKVTL